MKKITSTVGKENQLTATDRLAIQKLVVNAGGVETAKDFAEKYTMKAIHQIEKLPEADVKPMLLKIHKSVITTKIIKQNNSQTRAFSEKEMPFSV